MPEPITVREPVARRYEYVEQTYTYEELLDLFTSDGNVVRPLVLRCQEYEAEIARLKIEVEAYRRATTDAREAATWMLGFLDDSHTKMAKKEWPWLVQGVP